MAKSAEAFRTISEVAEWLDVQTHVLRFWESKFTQVKPVKRAGGRRYYRPNDMALLAGIRMLLHDDGVTIRGVQKILREKGVKHVVSLCDRPLVGMDDQGTATSDTPETSTPEPESGKVIPMQPVGNIANLFDSSDSQPSGKVAETEDPEPLTLFSHHAEPEAEPALETEPAAEPEAPADEPVPSFAHAASEAEDVQDEPDVSAEPVSPEPHAPQVTEIELPAASPGSGPALAAAAAAAARLNHEDLISRADRLAPAARRLQDLHARMTSRSS